MVVHYISHMGTTHDNGSVCVCMCSGMQTVCKSTLDVCENLLRGAFFQLTEHHHKYCRKCLTFEDMRLCPVIGWILWPSGEHDDVVIIGQIGVGRDVTLGPSGFFFCGGAAIICHNNLKVYHYKLNLSNILVKR